MSGNPAAASPAASLAEAPAPAPVPSAADERGISVSQAMSKVMEKGKTAFIPYITAGDPDLATTAAALRLLDAMGADVVELGMPFSDPSADGPVIQASAARALAAGATADAVMAMLKEVTPDLSCPVVIFCYLSPIAQRGTASFAAAVKEAGAKGLIVPDLPYAETSAFRDEAIKNDLELGRWRQEIFGRDAGTRRGGGGTTPEDGGGRDGGAMKSTRGAGTPEVAAKLLQTAAAVGRIAAYQGVMRPWMRVCSAGRRQPVLFLI